VADDDDETLPRTQAHIPPFDTGLRAQVPDPDADPPTADLTNGFAADTPAGTLPGPKTDLDEADAPPLEPIPVNGQTAVATASEPISPPAQSVSVPGRYYYLKWWQLVLMVAGVWIVAAVIGPALFFWWFHLLDKTPAVFVVLVYAVVCATGSLMLAMVRGRPLLSGLAIAVMSAPFASVAAAAPLYGYYYCQLMPRCLMGIIPY
jgi:hypothetical protein